MVSLEAAHQAQLAPPCLGSIISVSSSSLRPTSRSYSPGRISRAILTHTQKQTFSHDDPPRPSHKHVRPCNAKQSLLNTPSTSVSCHACRSRDPALTPNAAIKRMRHVAHVNASKGGGCRIRHFSHCPFWGWWRRTNMTCSRDVSTWCECLRRAAFASGERYHRSWAPSFSARFFSG